jgi:hypothetical protein
MSISIAMRRDLEHHFSLLNVEEVYAELRNGK